MRAQIQALGGRVNRRCADKLRQSFGELAGVPAGEKPEQMLADTQSEDAVTQKLKSFIVDAFRTLPVRPVRQRALETLGMAEMVSQQGLQQSAFLAGHLLCWRFISHLLPGRPFAYSDPGARQQFHRT